MEGVTVYGPQQPGEARVPVVSFNVDGIEAADVGTVLDVSYSVATRTGLHCAPLVHAGIGTSPKGTVRMSLGPFTTDADIDTALTAVSEIASGKALGR
jgi:selenocysteine lyase/cysteine desulfurase